MKSTVPYYRLCFQLQSITDKRTPVSITPVVTENMDDFFAINVTSEERIPCAKEFAFILSTLGTTKNQHLAISVVSLEHKAMCPL